MKVGQGVWNEESNIRHLGKKGINKEQQKTLVKSAYNKTKDEVGL